MIVKTMKCFNCKTEVLEKFTNEDYSEYLKKIKKIQKQNAEFGWICKNCGDKLCVMCRRETVSKFIPARKEGKIFAKIPVCLSCFGKFTSHLKDSKEIKPELLEPLRNLNHEEWHEFVEKSRKETG